MFQLETNSKLDRLYFHNAGRIDGFDGDQVIGKSYPVYFFQIKFVYDELGDICWFVGMLGFSLRSPSARRNISRLNILLT